MPKKFLDAEGVAYLASLLDNYPNNEILGTVINAIQDALTEKASIGNATQTTAGQMSAADKIKLDAMNGTSFQEIEVAITVSDWTNVAPYTYNWFNSAVTSDCYIDVEFKTNARGIFNGDISYDKITGGVQFVATEKPTDTINLIVQIIERQGLVQNTSGGGLSSEIKNALLNCFTHVAWTDANGSTYYNALYDALFSAASITATLNLNGALIRENNNLNDLKQYLTVTALQNDGSVNTLTAADYTLSGTIALDNGEYEVTTQTITVSYGGKTTTISVPVYNEMVVNRTSLPSGYTQLTMIQSDGSGGKPGAYIDTGINGFSVDHVKYGIQLADTSVDLGSNRHTLSCNTIYYPYFRKGNSGSQKFQGMYKRSDGAATELSLDWEPNTNYIIEAYPTVKINGETIATLTAGDTQTANTLCLCCAHGNSSKSFFSSLRIFSLQFFDSSNNITHNYIPCKNNQNIAGLYETVNGIFYPSSDDTHPFIAGEAI